MEQFFEEKTPKGFTLKILVHKGAFLVFDQRGATVYTDQQCLKVLHRIPIIAFLGSSFTIRNRRVSEFTMCKVSQNKIVIPFYTTGDRDMRYLLYETTENIDMIPVRINFISSVAFIAREVEAGMKPDVFVVDSAFSEQDLIVIKNRVPDARVFLTEDVIRAGIAEKKEITAGEELSNRAADQIDNANLNIMSDNPVFLARVHLRQNDVSKVRQLLFDFDLSVSDSGFILTFIDTMLRNTSGDLTESNCQKLTELRDEVAFYIVILEGEKEKIYQMIESITDKKRISSFLTLIAKARGLMRSHNDMLRFTEYENAIGDKKESLG